MRTQHRRLTIRLHENSHASLIKKRPAQLPMPRSEPALHQTPAKRRLTLAVGELIHGSGFAAFAMIVTFMSKPADGLSVLTDANKGLASYRKRRGTSHHRFSPFQHCIASEPAPGFLRRAIASPHSRMNVESAARFPCAQAVNVALLG